MGLLDSFTDMINGGPIRRRVAPRVEARNTDSLAFLLQTLRGSRTFSGDYVTDELALTLSSVFACADLLSELVSTLPVDEFRRVGSGRPEVVASPPLLVDPSGDGSGFESWSRQVMMSLLLRGNAYGLVTSLDDDVRPRHIEVLDPGRVSVRRTQNQGAVEFWLDTKNRIEKWPDGPLWHMPGSPVGLSPISYAKETIGVGIAARKFGAQWFGDGAHPTAVLESEHEITEDQARVLKERVYSALHDNRQALALGDGVTLKPFQVAPEESQFLETTQANVADVCRYFRVPPEMIGGKAADNLTYANQEQRAISLLTFTVNPWLVRMENALSRLRPRGRFVKFNAGALLRADLKTRYEAHVLAIRGGFNTPNERRNLEDYGPLPGGDELLWPPFSTGSSSMGDSDEGAPPS